MKKIGISYCIGVYNEEQILLSSLTILDSNLHDLLGHLRYEIIIVDNGSTDDTKKLLKTVVNPRVVKVFLAKKGHGLALRTAIYKAKYEYVVLDGIDLPFGMSGLKNAIDLFTGYDIIFGSKAHKDSIIHKTVKRELASLVFRILLVVLFRLKVHDAQGTLMFNKKKILKILNNCKDDGGFFTTQIAIYSQLAGYKMKEVPVIMKPDIRPSRYSFIRDGSKMLRSVFKEFYNLRVKNTDH